MIDDLISIYILNEFTIIIWLHTILGVPLVGAPYSFRRSVVSSLQQRIVFAGSLGSSASKPKIVWYARRRTHIKTTRSSEAHSLVYFATNPPERTKLAW